ncbi:restriction endonuclease subunit S [Acinetobacter sp. YWS30-1]|uniref:restriction endonuclease subunit S n=1 Tax=Acinetobacter sp. YWS30-1 TaxID=2996862 RepID=UPI002B263307|nr:restriction endonuclease subunit S [Acinetobacter sp. YWS30-1]WPC33868.1 restriction endonuclease subunit S [Acinetobacter sp. YWS30-1]
MAKYQKYAEYKDSGVEWLGEIPSHWNLFSLKRAVDGCTNGFWGSEPDGSNDLCVLRVADFNRHNFTVGLDKLTYRSVSQKEAENRLLKKGDLLLEKSGGGEKTLVGCVVQFNEDFQAITSNFVAKMTPKKHMVSRFLTFAFSHLYAGRVNFPSIKQTTGIQNLDSEAYLMEKFVFPTREEQNQIANFLDYETAKIDTLIAKQEKLIELLKEKRQAVISHAVTKGLNPDVTMKDSGVEWLGEVPEHWEIPKLLHITTRIGDGLHSTPLYQEGTGYYFINGNNLVDGKIFIGETAKEVPESEFIKHQVSLDKTTVLLSINGTIGKVAQFNDEPVILGKSASYINCCRELLPNFLMNYLTSSQAKNYYDLEVTGTTIYNLSLNSIRNMKVPLPPIDEQKNIILFIAEQYSKYDRLIQSSEKQNQLLKERRTALISSAVTGKIDVRHHVSRPSGNDKKQTEGI